MNETAGEIDVVAAGIEAVAAVPRSRVTLTERELEVLKGMANGQSNAEMVEVSSSARTRSRLMPGGSSESWARETGPMR